MGALLSFGLCCCVHLQRCVANTQSRLPVGGERTKSLSSLKMRTCPINLFAKVIAQCTYQVRKRNYNKPVR